MSVTMLHAKDQELEQNTTRFGKAWKRLTSIKQPKVTVYHPAVTFWSQRRVPLPCNRIAVGEEGDEGEEGVEAGKTCCQCWLIQLFTAQGLSNSGVVSYRLESIGFCCTSFLCLGEVATEQWISLGTQRQKKPQRRIGRTGPRVASGTL